MDGPRDLVIFATGFVSVLVAFLIFELGEPECDEHYRAWELLQESIADCREDPDCYLTLADRERVRDLALHVAACESREGGE